MRSSYLAVTGILFWPLGAGGGFVFKYFSSSKSIVRQFFSSLLSSQSFSSKQLGDLSFLIINLNAYLSVITSAVYADALAVATSELVGMAGTQLEFYAEIQDQN